ncbi:condensin-2 complex subunit H2 [Stegastes partitus]|uniref:Condensin-2 complex subunit H2 n=1 Tax=Stegastes partitus TaxID=144197 RepID=A0A3B4Z3E7_9TELE|nr:PREDICTED: condensin-2 complex subunit H2 [Stegastes partitus]
MESTQSRYAHLLQPIRELTKNWDVDLASELNDYLEELDDMCITFDGGRTRLNFAEAALLIQGSASIYSKKVELLHSLVYQTLEFISDRNKKRSKQAVASQEDGGVMDHHDDDVDEFTPRELQETENSQTCVSTAVAEVTPLPPESLIPPETREKQKLPLISVSGDVVCSQKDFKINLFIPGDEDLILLRRRSAAEGLLMQQQQDSVELHLQQQQQLTDAEAPAGGDEADEAGAEAVEDFMDVEEHIDRHQVSAPEGRMIRDRRQLEADRRRRMDELLLPEQDDVWTLHDAYAELDGEKPMKPGKVYRVPDGLDDGGKRKRKAAAALQDFGSWIRGTYDPSEHKLKNGPTFTDLNYIYLSIMEERLKTQKRINRRAGLVVSEDEMRRTFLQREEAGPDDQGEEPVDGFRAPELPGGDEDNFDNLEVFPDDGPAEGADGPDFISPEGQRDELSYEALVMLRVEQLVVNSQAYTQETALSRRVKDWEEKIRPHLQLQEERPTFDIHDYGERIVESLGAVGRRRFFSSIVHGLDPTEVCRFLLASLQLANDHTVEIDSAAGLHHSLDTMGLTLLSTQRATDRFRTLTDST